MDAGGHVYAIGLGDGSQHDDDTPASVIVFVLYKKETTSVAATINDKSAFRAVSLHGDMSLTQRQSALDLFRSREAEVLVATDVVARGIDVSSVSNVINLSVGLSLESWIHRVGRCGRDAVLDHHGYVLSAKLQLEHGLR